MEDIYTTKEIYAVSTSFDKTYRDTYHEACQLARSTSRLYGKVIVEGSGKKLVYIDGERQDG